jgi:hypothetical protein
MNWLEVTSCRLRVRGLAGDAADRKLTPQLATRNPQPYFSIKVKPAAAPTPRALAS